MMNYQCEKCLDTGSIKGELYLDCTSCDVAKERTDLHAYMAKNQFMHPYELAWLVHQRALAMAPKQEAPHGMAFIGMVGSEQFKYILEQLATGQPNPKERRRLVREVRDAIKLCAASQIKESAEAFSARDWIKVEDRLPEPYEEVRILFDGVPRIARLCHNRQYFQLATFIDSTKSQYIAIFDKVDGWMPLALAPGKESPVPAPAAANGAMPELPNPETMIVESDLGHRAYSAEQVRTFAKACLLAAAAGPDAALVKALEELARPGEYGTATENVARAALSGAKGN